MRQISRALSCALLLSGALCAQLTYEPDNGGDGVDGALFVNAVMTFDTDIKDQYRFSTFDVGPTGVLNVIGSKPLTIRVQAAVLIDGLINASGMNGVNSGNNLAGGAGGAGGPGAGRGGDGACFLGSFNGMGQDGFGVSPGLAGFDTATLFTDPVGGGGGGGNATAGMDGGLPTSGTLTTASGTGGVAVLYCRAGSGGGGGACDIDSATVATSNDGGGGGGGGGGRISIYSNASITVTSLGEIRARGGDGGTSTGNGGGGGGGSGGAIDLVAPVLLLNGTLDASGGAGGAATQTGCGCSPGGAGGDGCIELSGAFNGSTAGITPAATMLPYALILTNARKVGSFLVNSATGDSYLCSFSATLGAPIPLLVGSAPLELNLNDPLFALTFPTNQLAGIMSGLVGTASGSVTVNLNFLNALIDLTIYTQGVSFDAGAVTGVAPVRIVRIKLG